MKVILLMAITADGIIARDSKDLVDWTGAADKKYFVQVTKEAGVMIMGSKTFDTIGKVLPGRRNIVITRDEKRNSKNRDLIFTSQTPTKIVRDLETEGFTSAALIGGAIVNTLFMKENLIDEIHITIVPTFFGKGLSLFRESMDIQMELLDVIKLNSSHVLMKYKVKK